MIRSGGRRCVGRPLVPIQLLALLLLCMSGAVAQVPPPPSLFETGWEERDVFASELRPVATDLALALDEAPVYHLDWTLDDPTTLRAKQEVRVVNYSGDAWSELNFLLLPTQLGGRMFIERVRLNGVQAEPRITDGKRLLRIELPAPLEPDEAVVVALDYRLAIPETGVGNYGILAYNEGVLSLAHAYALLAVYDEEGWDLDEAPRYGDLVYARSSFFRVRLDAPAELDVVTSGRELERRLEGERQVLEMAAGPVRDFYLVAAEEFRRVARFVDGVTVNGYALPGTETRTEAAVEMAVRSLELFGDLYGPYPFRQLDIAPITTTALGVEFPGIIVLRMELLEGPSRGQLESTVVHEVAHQWFYSLVGNDQVSEPWLDESVTQYLTLRYYLEVHGEDGYRAFRRGLLARWGQIDREPAFIGRPVDAYTMNEYGAVVYGLGPLVLEWLRDEVGGDTFDAFLRGYVEEYAFGVAHTDDFHREIEERCDCSLDEFFAEWIVPGPLP